MSPFCAMKALKMRYSTELRDIKSNTGGKLMKHSKSELIKVLHLLILQEGTSNKKIVVDSFSHIL